MFKKYALIGATDRVNYGDNLFPILISKYIEQMCGSDVIVRNYGVLSSDLNFYGAIPTQPLSELYGDSFAKDSRVIVVGGEVLGGNWASIYRYCNDYYHSIYSNRIGKRIIRNDWVRKYLGGKGEFPFIPTPNMFKYDVSIAFNAVGGARSSKIANDVAPLLRNADYVSVRDNNTASYLKKAGLKDFTVSPDSALLMSKVFSTEFINKKSTEQVRSFIDKKPYIYFQVGNYKGGGNVEEIVSQLNNILKETDFEICLCPIGLAAGHDDHIALENIYGYIINRGYSRRIHLISKPTIWDTMNLIKNSSCYLGTSLHGVITAQSFSIPYLLINNSIKKGVEYINSWGEVEISNVTSTIFNFDQKFLSMNLDELSKQIAVSTSIQIDLAVKNINDIVGVRV